MTSFKKSLVFLVLVQILICLGPDTTIHGSFVEVPLSEAVDLKDAHYMWRYGGPYGYYCGIMHTSKIFDIPINSVDRACQLHDTCISSAGRYLDCACNEQLLVRMYDSCPPDSDAEYYRDQIIRAMNIGTSLCSNSFCNLMNTYYVSGELGFNGITFYGPGDKTIKTTGQKVIYTIMPNSSMKQFALDNLRGNMDKYLQDFKKMDKDDMAKVKIGVNETLLVFNPSRDSISFEAF